MNYYDDEISMSSHTNFANPKLTSKLTHTTTFQHKIGDMNKTNELMHIKMEYEVEVKAKLQFQKKTNRVQNNDELQAEHCSHEVLNSNMILREDNFKSDSDSEEDNKLKLYLTNWNSLNISPELKDLFWYILKYTPQCLNPSYALHPFLMEYIPSVGDVDAFLKIICIGKLKMELDSTYAQKNTFNLGLLYVDEPSGTQSEPKLLHLKLRTLRGSALNLPLHIPIANCMREIENWINEIELAYTEQNNSISFFNDCSLKVRLPNFSIVRSMYQSRSVGQKYLRIYINILLEYVGVEYVSEQDLILNLYKLFAMYLNLFIGVEDSN